MYQLDIYKYQNKKFDSLIAMFFEKSFCDDMRVMVFCEDEIKLKTIDKLLWEYNPASWIPHLTADENNAENAQIVLSQDIKNNVNQAKILCIIDSTIENQSNTDNIERITYFISNEMKNCDDSIELLKANSKLTNTYIQQSDGKWIKE